MAIERIIKAAVERGASDVHIKAGDVVRARIDGRLVLLTKQALTAEQTRAIALHFMTSDAERATIDTLKLPAVLDRIVRTECGMVLVTGVTGVSGSGKSSTMAALVNAINASYEKHILTLENPIEFIHADLKSSVTQREVGVDTESFRMGLRAALRQDPDVILIGEMRDPETIDTAMKAAETGHLLISTLHTPDAQSTIMRIVAMFPPEEQAVVRMRLAESLHAVVSQRLLPRANGQGRVLACEVMIVTSTIRDLIAEGNIVEIRDYIADGAQYGMRTFDQHLTELVNGNEVTFDVAKAAATNPADFELTFRIGKNRLTPHSAVKGIASRVTGSAKSVTQGVGAVATPSGLGVNPLGTGPTMPPIATSPSGHSAVSSSNPLGSDAVFGSGFESLLGG